MNGHFTTHVDMAGFTLSQEKAQKLARFVNQTHGAEMIVEPKLVVSGAVEGKYGLQVTWTERQTPEKDTYLKFSHPAFREKFEFREKIFGRLDTQRGTGYFSYVM